MHFTALHRALGLPPGPIDEDLLDAAIDARVAETSDLDWKTKLPPNGSLSNSDFPKDVAAMANSGGGLIVYGVSEKEKAAVGRVDTDELTENHERTLRKVCFTAIAPPILDLRIHRLGGEGNHAVVIEVPASNAGPHLVYRNELFGAPRRNDADTVWMQESQIEAMYRARFDERRASAEAVDYLFREAAAGRDTAQRAWMIGVARPRVPHVLRRLTRDEAREVFGRAVVVSESFTHQTVHPLDDTDRLNPRPGLRRWVSVDKPVSELSRWRAAWASIYHGGSVSLAASVGGWKTSSGSFSEGWQVRTHEVERAIADFMGLIRASAELGDDREFDVRVAVEWTGDKPVVIHTVDEVGFPFDGVSTPIHLFRPVDVTVRPLSGPSDYAEQVREIALDCINQGGLSYLKVIKPACGDE